MNDDLEILVASGIDPATALGVCDHRAEPQEAPPIWPFAVALLAGIVVVLVFQL